MLLPLCGFSDMRCGGVLGCPCGTVELCKGSLRCDGRETRALWDALQICVSGKWLEKGMCLLLPLSAPRPFREVSFWRSVWCVLPWLRHGETATHRESLAGDEARLF